MTTIFRECASLHTHSCYSLLDALPTPKEWVYWALQNSVPGLAITDHGNTISLFHCLKFKDYIKEYNTEHNANFSLDAVTPIPGMEAYVKLYKEDKKHYHATLLAVSNEGYFNLMKLSSMAFEDVVSYHGNAKARLTLDQIKANMGGIKITTGCIASPIGTAIMNDDEVLAEERFKLYVDMFGDDLYAEFHPTDLTHDFDRDTGGFKPFCASCCSPDGNRQKAYNCFLMKMVDKYNVKAIPATDAHFIPPNDKKIQDAVLQAGDATGWRMHGSYHAHLTDEIFSMLRKHLGEWLTEERFNGWIDNTLDIREQAKSIDIKFDYNLPKIEIPDCITKQTDDYDKQTYLLLLEKIKLHGRWKEDEDYKKRFEKEIDVIMHNEKFSFLPYFLMYEDLCTHARSIGILQNIGRGSAGGCLISYYLKIVHIDPMVHGLPFERFLSHARIRGGSYPDIDADFSDRKPIVDYLQKKYGAGFAQIATFNKMKTKNAIKDAMWSLYGHNANHPEVKIVCDSIADSSQGIDEHEFLYGATDQEGNYMAGQVEVNEILRNFFARYPEVEKMVNRLIGTMRNWSRHPSAFVISSVDLSSTRVPTMRMKDPDLGMITVTQYDAPMVEKSGLIKADILVVKTLQATAECVDLIKKRTGKDYLEEDANGVPYLYRLPEDPAVYADFYNKDTDTSFQFSTDLIKQYLPKFIPTSRKQLADLTALCRPGALDAPVVLNSGEVTTAAQQYVDVRGGLRTIEYIHPDLMPILKDTNGIMVYQEQVAKILMDVVGYTGEQADIVRAAIGKKKKDVIQNTFSDIRKGAIAKGWSKEQCDALCKQIEAFCRYSFNMSHSASYAELGYITMYLKHHYRLEWWTGVLNLHLNDEDKMRKDISLLEHIVVPPSILSPSPRFSICGDKIASPLSVIKGAGPKIIEELCNKAPFKSLDDFILRIDHAKVNTSAFSALVKARAFDPFMDKTKPYIDARIEFLQSFIDRKKILKGTVPNVKEDVLSRNPLDVFLMEREVNVCFNRGLLESADVVSHIIDCWPNTMSVTGSKDLPLSMRVGHSRIPIIAGISVAERLLKRGFDKEIGAVLLFTSSTIREGVSKKNGKPYKLLSVSLSDGYKMIECTVWNAESALRYPKNSLVYVRGTLKEGWKQAVNLNLNEIEIISKVG